MSDEATHRRRTAAYATMVVMSSTPNARGLGAIPAQALQLEYPLSLGVFDRYEDAQKAVDYLSDHEFPVRNVMIVGTDLKQIERVTGRLTKGRVLAGGALSGMWMGAFVAMVFAWVDTKAASVASFVATMAFGALFGLIWVWLTYRLTGGARDFTSVSQVVATKYEVLVEHRFVTQARELLGQMDPLRAAQEQIRQVQEAEAAAYADRQRAQPPAPPGAG